MAYSVGYNIDMLSVAPTAALTSSQNNWSVLYKAALEKFIAGEEMPADYACGYADDAVMISALGESCAEGTQEAVDAAWAGIADGSLQVFDTSKYTVGGQTVEATRSISPSSTLPPATWCSRAPPRTPSSTAPSRSPFTAPPPTSICASTASPS
ncbi:MAG: hypothetical protein V8R40_05155 [Dysosmobacter sp.]